MAFALTSPAASPGERLPARHTADGLDESPPLAWTAPPEGTRALALVVTDPDAPGGTFVHWVLFDLPPGLRRLPAGVPRAAHVEGGRQAKNDFGRLGYGGPAPPPGPAHRYVFRLYSLDRRLDLAGGGAPAAALAALEARRIGLAELVVTYGRAT